jgi:hypothetical protein
MRKFMQVAWIRSGIFREIGQESSKFKKPRRIHYPSFREEGETQIDTGLRMHRGEEDRFER